MKKLISILIILVIIDVAIVSANFISFNDKVSFNELKNQKNDTWEQIITQVYGRGIKKGKTLFKYKGPILFKLKNAIDKDSLAFNSTLQYFKDLLPNQEIDYFSNFVEKHTINKDSLINDYPLYFLKTYAIEFNVNNTGSAPWGENVFLDVIDNKTFAHFRSIIQDKFTISGYVNSKTKFNFIESISAYERAKVFKNVIFKILSAKSFHVSDDYTTHNITESDELVLQKFYRPTFEKDLKNYMEGIYGWRYTNHFLDKESYLKKVLLIVFSIGTLLFILIFSYFQNRKFKYEYLNYFLPILLITISYTNLSLVYKYFTSFNFFISWSKDILSQIVQAIIFSIVTSFLMYIIEKLAFKRITNFSFKLLFKVVITFIVLNLPFLGYAINYNESIVLKHYWPLLLLWSVLAIGRGLLIYLNHFSASLVKEKDVELSRLKEINTQSELKLLQLHINPHFLYNALNSIAGLAHTNANKTEKMALSLSDLFRYSINKKGKKMSTIHEEMEMVQNYMEIEKIRFGKRLQFSLAINEDVKDEKIPMYILQPLVENAIKHGISKIAGNAKISIEIKKEQQQLLIVIGDNGPNFPERLVSGHGLQTVYDLLRLSYGENAAITWQNSPKKQIIVSITQNV